MGMDQDLLNFMNGFMPKFNEDIIHGLATKIIPNGPHYIDEIFTTIAKDFPPEATYEGWAYCTPNEELEQEPRPRPGGKIPIDVSPSSIYMTYYKFTFDGELIKLPLFMPHPGPAGSLMFSGSRYYVSPVLSDIVYSYDKDRIYVQFRRAKFHIATVVHGFVIDNNVKEVDVSWSVLYNMKAASKEAHKVALLHYILGHYGFSYTFARWGKCHPILGYKDINYDNYPRESWVHINSTFPQNRNFRGGTPIRMVIPRNEYEANKEAIDILLGSLYFIMDLFPEFITPGEFEDTTMWRIAMGRRLWGNEVHPGILLDDINKHFDSMDCYVDDLVKPDLKRVGMESDNLYEFLALSMLRMDQWKEERYAKSSVLYGKELSVLYNIFQAYNDAIFKFNFDLVNESKKGKLTKQVFEDILRKRLTPRMVFQIRSGDVINIGGVNYCGDNEIAKITSTMTPQTGSDSSGEGQAARKRLHVSVAEFGSLLRLSKDTPTGETSVNVFTRLTPNGELMRDPRVIPIADEIQRSIDKIKLSHVQGMDTDTFDATDMRELTDLMSEDK